MKVVKRNKQQEDVSFDKILNRVKNIGKEFNVNINYSALVVKVIDQLYTGISTKQIDELTAEQCASLSTHHPDYSILAAAIIVSNHQKSTNPLFHEVMDSLYNFKDINKNHSPLITEELYKISLEYSSQIQEMLDFRRDYLIDFFGFKTLERAYLMKVNKTIVERPQHLWMRVAIGIHGADLHKVKETYDLMSQKYFTHATPTLFNAGTPHPQLSSCYLIAMENDSIDGIYNTLRDCARISKWAGGIGLHIHNIRGTGSHIRGTNGTSNGIIPMLRVFNMTARYVDQGGGKRSGSFAIYLEPWHTDIEDFLELRKNHGDEEMRCRDLFLGLWTPDLFMDRVKNDKTWSLFCPDQCPGLSDAYGDDFKDLYETYEKEGKAMKTLKARELWFKILDAQMETGTPYILFKDAANKKSNQKNLGTIKSSNLCVAPETLILTDRGNIEIKRLENQKINVWNGEEFSEVTVRKTGNNQELIRVNFSNNKYIDCTPYHKFYINFYNNDIVFEAQELKSGMKIINYKLPNDNNVITDIYVKNVENLNRFDNTFCFTEPKRHMGIFNGIIAGQCTEIIEYSSPDETAVCNLASISLGKFVAPKINYKKANVFSKSGCEFCVKAKALLKENNIFYEETILDNEKERKSFYQEVTYSEDVNVNSMPQIYLDDEYVGGYQNLEKLLTPIFNYNKLHEVTKVVTQNLNKIIDINFYPTDKTHRSNMLHRPIGIGIQGLADAFFMLDIPFHSQEAIEVNKKIFETMYHAALEKSMELSIERRQNLSELYDYLVNNEGCEEIKEIKEIKESKLYNKNIKFIKPEINEIYHKYKPTSDELFGNHERMAGHPRNKNHLGAYSSFENSPAYNGFLQFDMWNVTPSTRYDWNDLKEKIITNGMRNSLLIAPMPTASTSQILGNNECFEPVTSNIYTRRTLAGEFVMANKYLMCDLIKIGKWDENIKNNIIANKGSVQQLSFLSQHLKDKYKIVWEIPMKQLIDMSRDRGAFICQSQSLNLWVEDPDYKILTSMYFYAYQAGLKTGVYYLRRKPKHQAQQFTIEPDKKEDKKETEYEICEMCSA